MFIERIWGERVILSLVILFVWMSIFSAILSFTFSSIEISNGIQDVLVSGLIILAYIILIKLIVKLDWNLNTREHSLMKLLL